MKVKNFIEKHGNTVGWFAWVGAVLSVGAGYVVSLIRDDKREIKRHKKLEEVYQARLIIRDVADAGRRVCMTPAFD